MQFKTLNRKFSALLLIPVVLTLIIVGAAGFLNAYDKLLSQWKTASLFSLERAAHAVDMRLQRPVEAVNLIGQLAKLGLAQKDQWEIELRKIPGVKSVTIDLKSNKSSEKKQPPSQTMRGMAMEGHHQGQMSQHWMHSAKVAQVIGPELDAGKAGGVVTLIFELKDEQGIQVGKIHLGMSLGYFTQELHAMRWWHNDDIYLIDAKGSVLVGGQGHDLEHPRWSSDVPLEKTSTLAALQVERSGTLLGPGFPAQWVSGWHRLQKAPWTLVVFSTGRKVLGSITGFVWHFLLVGTSCIILVTFLIRFVTSTVSRSVREVSDASEKVSVGNYTFVPPSKGKDEIARLINSFNLMVDGLKERDFIRDTFSRYVDRDVVQHLLTTPGALKLGGDKRPVVVMMTDIRGFTALSERLGPEETIKFINHYLTSLIAVVHDHQGIIVDFLGDAILAFFDTDSAAIEKAAHRGLCCAMAIQAATAKYNVESQQSGLPSLGAGVGLHAGEVVVGNIGSETRAKYGIVGGPVNITQRIQSEAGEDEVVCSEKFYSLVKGEVQLGRSFLSRLKGLEGEHRIFVLQGMKKSCG